MSGDGAKSGDEAVVALLARSSAESESDDEADDETEFETHPRIVTHRPGIGEPGARRGCSDREALRR